MMASGRPEMSSPPRSESQKKLLGWVVRGLEDPNDCLGPDERANENTCLGRRTVGSGRPELSLPAPLRRQPKSCWVVGWKFWKTRMIVRAPMGWHKNTCLGRWSVGLGKPELSSPPRCEGSNKPVGLVGRSGRPE